MQLHVAIEISNQYVSSLPPGPSFHFTSCLKDNILITREEYPCLADFVLVSTFDMDNHFHIATTRLSGRHGGYMQLHHSSRGVLSSLDPSNMSVVLCVPHKKRKVSPFKPFPLGCDLGICILPHEGAASPCYLQVVQDAGTGPSRSTQEEFRRHLCRHYTQMTVQERCAKCLEDLEDAHISCGLWRLQRCLKLSATM